jgi:hypothetical protein
MLDARERGDRNPGAMLTAHELPPTLVEHGVVAQAQEHEIGKVGCARRIHQPGSAPTCSDCGSLMVGNGACYKCHNFGATSRCS